MRKPDHLDLPTGGAPDSLKQRRKRREDSPPERVADQLCTPKAQRARQLDSAALSAPGKFTSHKVDGTLTN